MTDAAYEIGINDGAMITGRAVRMLLDALGHPELSQQIADGEHHRRFGCRAREDFEQDRARRSASKSAARS